jgi:pyridoxal phosphate enzyme (YggS family)
MTIADNIQRIQDEIASACARAGRSTADVTLIAVSKTHPAGLVLEAAAVGLQHFGENRVEEAESKIPAVNQAVTAPLTWHMVGHVQSRKAKDVVGLFDLVHSVDSLKLAQKFSTLAQAESRKLDVLLEVNVSGEESKYGLDAARWASDSAARDALWNEIRQIAALPGLNVRGLMTVAPIVPKAEDARPVFAGLVALRAALADSLRLPLPDLSMGMTDDFQIAIEEGSTMVRIGRAIFGERHL